MPSSGRVLVRHSWRQYAVLIRLPQSLQCLTGSEWSVLADEEGYRSAGAVARRVMALSGSGEYDLDQLGVGLPDGHAVPVLGWCVRESLCSDSLDVSGQGG